MYLEKQILGCFLKDNALLKETNITADYFEDNTNKIIYESMQKLSREDSAVDKVTLMADNYQHLEKLGGVNFIENIEQDGDVDNFQDYEKKFTEQYKKNLSDKVVKAWLSKEQRELSDLLSKLQKIDEFGLTETEDKNSVLLRLHDEAFQEKETIGIPTGLEDLDQLLGAFQNGLSYIVGARPSMGKTALMLYFAREISRSGAVPLIFSIEMGIELLTRRMIATEGNINSFIAKNPYRLSESMKNSWQAATNNLYKLDFEIYDEPYQTPAYIRSKVRQAKKKYEGKQIMVLIDYLTLLDVPGDFASEHNKVTEISRELKRIAKEFFCPVLTLAQLSRSVENRQDKRAMLSDLRESGSIEQDADAILFLYRESYYSKEDDNTMEINVAKNRDGPTGTITVYYNKATGKIGDLSDDY